MGAIQKHKMWIDRCVSATRKHAQCDKHTDFVTELPTRVVDVGSEERSPTKVYLLSQGQNGSIYCPKSLLGQEDYLHDHQS